MICSNIEALFQVGIISVSIDQFTGWFREVGSKLIGTIIVILVMIVTLKIGDKVIKKWVKRKSEKANSSNDTFSLNSFNMDEKLAKTIGAILRSLLKYAVYFIGITSILSIYFGTVSLTLASIGGVAIGFGAQNLVKDVISGIFLLIENQYMVGESIEIQGSTGVVESIEIRVTRIRDANGDIHIIPNGSILKVTNKSRGSRRALVEVTISYDSDLNKAIDIINEVCLEYGKDDENIVELPQVVGITELGARGINIRVVGRTKPTKEWNAEVELRKKIKLALDDNNISIPYNTK
ncbi:mechanosensitive ion channel family protein [Clostridium cellulovorans]|uniref:MscS Mechanosensitive ion channel n=1 Tax=Clostridium cellulovorans (strain ATCC 35296 / DSM 3052 / OCM 3 / 743B) TaxID=573061 RepID=D9SPC4_CLOC7|nr:mechanosensitive ion channel family protein [Clostridium cellulovorans]ADL54026.1 MscS Mechanosensitive ion channel [Clostridium cellulovorans 743B]